MAAVSVLAATLAVGCSKQDDPIAAAEKKDRATGVAGPGIAETRAIAEEGFICGLPIVMSYAAMYEFAVDRNSDQFKARSTRSRHFDELGQAERLDSPGVGKREREATTHSTRVDSQYRAISGKYSGR